MIEDFEKTLLGFSSEAAKATAGVLEEREKFGLSGQGYFEAITLKLLSHQIKQLSNHREQGDNPNSIIPRVDETFVLFVDDALLSAYAEFYDETKARGFNFRIPRLDANDQPIKRDEKAVAFEQTQCLAHIFRSQKYIGIPPFYDGLKRHVAFFESPQPSDFEDVRSARASKEVALEKRIDHFLERGVTDDAADARASAEFFRDLIAFADIGNGRSEIQRLTMPFALGKVATFNSYDFAHVLGGSSQASVAKSELLSLTRSPLFAEFRDRIGKSYLKFCEGVQRRGANDQQAEILREADYLSFAMAVQAVLGKFDPNKKTAIITTSIYASAWWMWFDRDQNNHPLLIHPKFLSAYDLTLEYSGLTPEKLADWKENLANLTRSVIGGAEFALNHSGQALIDEVEQVRVAQSKVWHNFKSTMLDDWKKSWELDGTKFFKDLWDEIESTKNETHKDKSKNIINRIRNRFHEFSDLEVEAQRIDKINRDVVRDQVNHFIEDIFPFDESEVWIQALDEVEDEPMRSVMMFRTGRMRYAIKIDGLIEGFKVGESRNIKLSEVANHLVAPGGELGEMKTAKNDLLSLVNQASHGLWGPVVSASHDLIEKLSNDDAQALWIKREAHFILQLAHRAMASEGGRGEQSRATQLVNAWNVLRTGAQFSQRKIRFRLARVGFLLELMSSPQKVSHWFDEKSGSPFHLVVSRSWWKFEGGVISG